MDIHLTEELLNELASSLENLEAQQGALLQFLKDKGVITDEQFEPYLTQAGNASSVRWRAARVRLEHILSGVRKREEAQEQTRKEAEQQRQETQSQEKKQSINFRKHRQTEQESSPEEEKQTKPERAQTEGATATASNRQKKSKKEDRPDSRHTAADEDAA